MEKVLTLSTEDWMNGIKSYPHFDGTPALARASSCHPFRTNKIMGNGYDGYHDATGAMALHPQFGGMLSTDLLGTIFGFDVNTNTIYTHQNTGDFYEIDTDAETSTNLRDSTNISNSAKGMIRYQPQGGNEYLYYAQDTQIGRWDLSGSYPTGWTDDWQTGLNSTNEHHMHAFLDRVYICNGDEIDQIGSDGNGSATYTRAVLDFSSKYEATCMSDTGRELIVGLSSDSDSIKSKVLFWNTNTESWQKELTFQETNKLYSIRRVNRSTYYALSPDGLFVFGPNTPPQRIYDNVGSLDEGYPSCMQSYKEGVLFVTADDQVMYYGEALPEAPTALHNIVGLRNLQDAAGSGSTGLFIIPIPGQGGYLKFWLGSTADIDGDNQVNESNILRHKVENFTTQRPETAEFSSRMIDLQDPYQISRVDIIFGAPLIVDRNIAEPNSNEFSEADEIEFSLLYPGGFTDSFYPGEKVLEKTISASNDQHFEKTRVPVYVDKTRTVDELGFEVSITGGDPIIKRIEFYGEEITF